MSGRILGTVRSVAASKAAALSLMAGLAFALALPATSVLAQTPAPTPWVLSPDMGYAYDASGKTLSYKMGTNNAKFLLKGAKKVPKNTLFFIGENGQLYMRTGPYLEGDGKFSFGPG